MRLNKHGLIGALKSSAGRSNGKKILRHRASLVCYNYRVVDFSRLLKKELSIVRSFFYDPGRTAILALCVSRNGLIFYILSCKGLEIGTVVSSCYSDLKTFSNSRNSLLFCSYIGWASYLKNFSIGCFLHSIVCPSLSIGKCGMFMRIACALGAYAQVLKYTVNGVILRLGSGEHRIFSYLLVATLGIVFNPCGLNNVTLLRKAGEKRLHGFRPSVRGSAMNPVDHPHGGGAGRTSGKRGAFSPWGKFSKGSRTRIVKFSSRNILKRRYEK
jgi:large subunit ribosomal protein L2